MTLGGQLQSLLLGPQLDTVQSSQQLLAHGPRAQRGVVCYQPVEQPLINEVKQLREQLDCERGIHSGTQQQRHRPRHQVHHVVCHTNATLV